MESIEVKCLNHGFVALEEVMGDDRTAARAARTSFRTTEEKTAEEDARLTAYLVRNRHTTPLEFCQARFYMKMPIFVARQWIRHRTASVNETSLRYVRAAKEFYIPDIDRMQKQSETNKQGSAPELIAQPERWIEVITMSCGQSFSDYERLIGAGLSKELARTVLPLGTYTEWRWQCDLHNILHLLGLRLDPHAQYEIRVYAEAILALLRPVFPTAIEAWEEGR
jgi:thymidylate synthase (FAD)